MFAKRKCLSLLPLPLDVFNDANIVNRYKPDVKIRLIADELGFGNDEDAAQFIVNHGGEHLLEERGADFHFLTGKAVGFFEKAKGAAFGRVDIKGQI